ncbi:MAG TPA: tyrosine-protein phosphatase [Dehalococcoidia bacterium]
MVRDLRERRIPLTGCVNFRDLGGYPTKDGRRIRWRRLFRSDSLHQLTPEDLAQVRALGLAVAFDLRTSAEVQLHAVPHLAAAGVRHCHVPFIPAVDRAELARMVDDLSGHYLRVLDTARPAIRELFGTLAEPRSYPAVIYCMAGKDRTGLAAALVLRALGVSDDHVVTDYALTETYAGERLRARTAEILAQVGALPPAVLAATPLTMERTLATLDETYGSTEAFLLACGVTRDELKLVRAHLLEDAATDPEEAVTASPV